MVRAEGQFEQMRRELKIVLARGCCKNITRQEVHALVDEILDEYSADATPTIMIFKDGEVISTLVGAVSEDAIMNELE